LPVDVKRRKVLHGIAAGSGTLLLRAVFPRPVMAAVESGPPSLELTVSAVNDQILRVIVAAGGEPLDRMYEDGSIVVKTQPSLVRVLKTGEETTTAWEGRTLRVLTNPLRLRIEKPGGAVIQEIAFQTAPSRIAFSCGSGPLYGLGQGAHKLDRRGTTDSMGSGQLGEDLRIYGAHVPIPWLMSPAGWGLFFHEPWGSFDLTANPGVFKPEEDARGIDLFVLVGDTPAELMKQWAELTGYPHLPPVGAWLPAIPPHSIQSRRSCCRSTHLPRKEATLRYAHLPRNRLLSLRLEHRPWLL
jgi:hypothetical protein